MGLLVDPYSRPLQPILHSFFQTRSSVSIIDLIQVRLPPCGPFLQLSTGPTMSQVGAFANSLLIYQPSDCNCSLDLLTNKERRHSLKIIHSHSHESNPKMEVTYTRPCLAMTEPFSPFTLSLSRFSASLVIAWMKIHFWSPYMVGLSVVTFVWSTALLLKRNITYHRYDWRNSHRGLRSGPDLFRPSFQL